MTAVYIAIGVLTFLVTLLIFVVCGIILVGIECEEALFQHILRIRRAIGDPYVEPRIRLVKDEN